MSQALVPIACEKEEEEEEEEEEAKLRSKERGCMMGINVHGYHYDTPIVPAHS